MVADLRAGDPITVSAAPALLPEDDRARAEIERRLAEIDRARFRGHDRRAAELLDELADYVAGVS